MRSLLRVCLGALVMGLGWQEAFAVKATPNAPVELTGTQGKFDFIEVDPRLRRLLACHTENNSLDVIDLDASKLLKSIPTGAAQGVAIDDKNGRYYVSVSRPPRLVIIDSAKLEVLGEVSLPGPADLVAYHEGTNRVFVCSDEKPEMWIIDPEAKSIVKTLTFPGGGMEDLGFDATGNFLFQNLKESSQVAKVGVIKQEVIDAWPTAPSTGPHGLVVVPQKGDLLIAGGGKLTLLNPQSGRIVDSADIADKVDEIAYDPGLHLIYGASGKGIISVVLVKDDLLVAQPPIPNGGAAHSIAVDPKTHAVWIAFAKDAKSYAQKFDIVDDTPPPKPVPSASPTPSPK